MPEPATVGLLVGTLAILAAVRRRHYPAWLPVSAWPTRLKPGLRWSARTFVGAPASAGGTQPGCR
ncbi:MAG: PEP-CTERM sorting domain-containing protein [Opitutales bacterium]